MDIVTSLWDAHLGRTQKMFCFSLISVENVTSSDKSNCHYADTLDASIKTCCSPGCPFFIT